MLTTIFRRHTANCVHKSKGRDYLKCSCPLWADGYQNGKRTFLRSLGTRDMARARKRAMALEADDAKVVKSITAAVSAFKDHCSSHAAGTHEKMNNALKHLQAFCDLERLENVDELTVDALDKYRAGRKIAPITSLKELEILRQFCGFCFDRGWMPANSAKKIKGPKNIQPNDVVPFTNQEVRDILAACDKIGQEPYERLRARAMILTLRYTALRIGDVALLEKNRISKDGKHWRIFLRTQKAGKPVFLPIPYDLKHALDCVPAPIDSKDSPYYFWNGKHKPESCISAVDRCLRIVFKKSGVLNAHAHRFRHTLATELLEHGASFEEVADVLGNTPEIARKHYAKWSPKRQARIDDLMGRVHEKAEYTVSEIIQ